MKNPGVIIVSAILFLWSVHVSARDIEATLSWSMRVELSSPVSGVVREVLVNTGTLVKKDGVLLRLDPRPFEARLKKANTGITRAHLARDEAKRELERSEELFDRTVISPHELDLEKIAYSKAAAEYQAALSEQNLAKLDMEYSEVRAPFDGWVLQRLAQPGQVVNNKLQNETLMVLAEAGRMLAGVFLSREEIEQLSHGDNVTITVDGKSFQGKVVSIGMEPAPDTNRYLLEVKFSVPDDQRYRPGQKVIMKLP